MKLRKDQVDSGGSWSFPDVYFIAAHWGGGLPFYSLMPEIQRITAHVWYDMAATPYLYRNSILPIVADLVGAERILYASDYGLLRQQRVINYVTSSGLHQNAIDLILGGNAQQLLDLKSRNAEGGQPSDGV